ncbi:bifunctional tRNA (5-methylaminomethyl-2-thiouridine)(34)-methyltransferase MnmD/FAD-dependent 5-carboxymethylaminomethyl-2-thiouridine(34) oxidoreductase MnmC [Marinobacter zhanjiangensis]|uniref:tRNA 5-methylaminomethyl-2-thiouridine biosynthesis bifunctional protein MnmC n=1 Tax=Marinobacter zhanjiangensis TaxID=578215 RepID=A0ABQ3ASV1_9GAMM|nr:bifunctional tRNA (5-methylaminomethyl-2-thiouridine)(34)-methyltransferase MnmD/FAD-dependent 5-carboxymethylaminomethyl-2-thiouridine(34) oxidoreductase MnmC [Marinobacter zhanjiangensis]GGY66752.1 tRNA 5-methylaminomethyl-2-thiouridine biosynthesis bifunctional protein MnmC [Marinobacter zhanjiangensis]
MERDSPKLPSIEPAILEWHDGQPVSARFGDVYFSRDDGLEEARHVFLRHNQLPERFARLQGGDTLVVAETGFGTGLNFLATWQSFRERAPAGAMLHFVSVERYPLTSDDLRQTLSLWPELAPLADELCQQYPPLVAGSHRLVLDSGRVRLTLYFGDGLEALEDLAFNADAWFLDGFAPACNPGIWQDRVMEQVRRHSRPGATLSTFTAVGRIRRTLAEAGFQMQCVAGFGHKREMLRGELPTEAGTVCNRPDSVLVVGAGVAGSLLARNLADRGLSVVVADQGDRPGAGASGNAQGALYAKLGVQLNDQTRLSLAALLHAQRYYPLNTPGVWHGTGLLMMGSSDQERQRQQKFLRQNEYPASVLTPVSAGQARTLTGVACPHGGLWFPGSGWLEPSRLCATLLDHPRIRTEFGFRASRLLPCNNRWCLSGEARQDLVADAVVIAAGHETRKLMPVLGEFRMKPIRGQVTALPVDSLSETPKAVIAGSRYLNPPMDGMAVTGATFDLHDADPRVRLSSDKENMAGLNDMIPGMVTSDDAPSSASSRVSFRCTTHDYQPIAGPMVNGEGRVLEAAWLFTGLGSKGLMWAPLLAEYLADCLTGHPAALPRSLARRVDPKRCLAKPVSSDTRGELA